MATAHELAFEAFGVRILLSTDSRDAFEALPSALPPTSRACSTAVVDYRLKVLANDAGTYDVEDTERRLCAECELGRALLAVERTLRTRVAEHAPSVVFVHAGVVAHHRRTIVMPGQTFAGKSTLVRALVKAGAVYFSDEFAVIDEGGLVHPYAKPLSLRDAHAFEQTDYPIESLGGTVGDQPLPVGAVVMTSYRAGARWIPEQLSAGRGVLALAQFAVPVRQRPKQVLRALSRAVANAIVLLGERGEADAVADRLLRLLES